MKIFYKGKCVTPMGKKKFLKLITKERKPIAQYKFDANRYENLLPEFNAEFTADKYIVTDDVHELVLDNMSWYDGILLSDGSVGYSEGYPRAVYSNYFRVTPNIIYNVDFSIDTAKDLTYVGEDVGLILNIHWYDINKNHVKSLFDATGDIAPSNAAYVRFCTDAQDWDDQEIDLKDCRVSAKLVNRTIKSVNGDLPTLMRFGQVYVEGEIVSNASLSLLEVCQTDTSNITNAQAMFRNCRNMISVGELDTSNVTDMQGMFYYCNKLTSIDVSNWDTSKVTNMAYMFSGCSSLNDVVATNVSASTLSTLVNELPTRTSTSYGTIKAINTTDEIISFAQSKYWNVISELEKKIATVDVSIVDECIVK